MTSKKKMGSKLANSVRQVKLQREQTPMASAKATATEKTKLKSETVPFVAKPAAPRAAKKSATDHLHPQRVWPD